jgi:hypothetical protein
VLASARAPCRNPSATASRIAAPLRPPESRPLAALVPLVAAFAACLVMLGVAVTALCRTLQQANAVAFGGIVLFGALALTRFRFAEVKVSF